MLRQRHSLPNFAAGLLTCLSFLSLSIPGATGELPVPAATVGTNASPTASPALEEALRQLKEQQTSTFQALDLIRHQTESALHENAFVLSNQLAQFSAALTGNSAIQLKFMRDTEKRTLQVTLLILLAVLLGVGSLVFVAARAFSALAKRLPLPVSSPSRPEPPPPPARVERPVSVLEQAATSAYTAALLDVETRIAALERRPASGLSGGPTALAAGRQSPSGASKASAPSRPASSSSLAMTLNDGQAIVFYPCEDRAGSGGRIGEFFLRIGRLFGPRKTTALAKPLPNPKLVKC